MTMSLIMPRRRFLLGLGAALAAPAIVRFESLMPVKAPKLILDDLLLEAWQPFEYQWLLNGVPIPGETGREITAVPAWNVVDGRLSVRVTASDPQMLAAKPWLEARVVYP